MITFERLVLTNGLKVVLHQDKSTPLVAVNVTYNVGSKDEHPDKTGFAHLFEHLMFGGSKHIKDFDEPIQTAGGENNAFTNSDYTNFHEVLPAKNLDIALWLESDRMLELRFSQRILDTQKKVVIEEFKETCLNEPYGDMWHHMSDLAYTTHPYKWPTIGKEINHIKNATLDDVKAFFYSFYRPNNAILVIAGNIDIDQTIKKVKYWFEDIPSGNIPHKHSIIEPPQNEHRYKALAQRIPNDALYLGYHISHRFDKEYYVCDLISDLLATGRSSRFYQKLYKEKKLFSTIDAFISGTNEPGLFLIEGKTMPNVSLRSAKEAIIQELTILSDELISDRELQKLKNRVESSLVFSEVNILNKAISLGYFELEGNADIINHEADRYFEVTAQDIRDTAAKIFNEKNCSELVYFKN